MDDQEYALCWEDPGDGEGAWVIRYRRSPGCGDKAWDRWRINLTLAREQEEAAKAWAVVRLDAAQWAVVGWHRDKDGDLIPERAS